MSSSLYRTETVQGTAARQINDCALLLPYPQFLLRSPQHCWHYTTGLRAHKEQESARADKQLQFKQLPSHCCIHWYCKTHKEQEASLLSSCSLTARHRNNFLSQFAWIAHRSTEKSLLKLDGNPQSPKQGLAKCATKSPWQFLQR